jgi:SpoVK/Ycf46/Vps4 family AAA+-type ATPase
MPKAKRNAEDEIALLIRARYPIVYISSYEEARVIDALKRITGDRSKKLFTWTITEGLKRVDAPDLTPPVTTAQHNDAMAMLDFIGRSKDNAVYVLIDFHPYLEDKHIVRKLRDLAQSLKASYKTLIILSPVLSLPAELEKDVTLVEFPLPDEIALRGVLDEIINSLRDNAKVTVDLDEAATESLVKAALGLTAAEAENAFAKAIVLDGALTASDLSVILEEKEQVIQKTGFLQYYHAQTEINHIGGMDKLKVWLHKRAQAFTFRAQSFGLPAPKGLLLIGVQGCGKSLTAKAVSSLWQMPLLRLDLGALFSGYIGSSEENTRKAIAAAERVAPCILWLDEIEKGLSGVQSSAQSDAGTASRVFSTFLTWMQEKEAPVFVIATANEISQLPPELMRKGRFDEIFFIDLPQSAEREEIFRIHLLKRGRKPEAFDTAKLAQIASGFSGAEIEQAIISALYDAFDEGTDIGQKHIEDAICETVPLSKTACESINELRSWAESRARFASSRPDKAT